MSNTLVTTDLVTREALRLLEDKMSFLGTINRQYDSSFGPSGGKHGSTLKIREPNQYTRRQGSRVMDVQDQDETTQTLTVATQDGVDMRFNSAELSNTIDYISERYIAPAINTLVAGIEGDVMASMTKSVYNYVGTAGTSPSDLADLGAARARLNQCLAPTDSRCVQLDSVTMGGLVNGLKGLFQDSEQIKRQYREGMIGRTAMADFYENEKILSLANSTDVACTLDTYTVVNGDSDLTVTSFATPTAGMVFTIAGVYDVHPLTKQPYSQLKQFTVLAGSTSTNLLISPTIYLSGAKQNVSGAPSTTAALTFWGNASTTYTHGLMYHKDAFTFVTADLPIMDDAAKCVRRVKDNLSLRVWQASDIRNDELLMRIDILYGSKAIRPEWACRISH